MSASQRLRICYLVPGHDLVASMGPTRNVLSLATAMAEFADVSIAFRRISEGPIPNGLRAMEISPHGVGGRPDDSATSGMGLTEFIAYLRDLRHFCRNTLADADVVLEKSWLLSGLVSSRWLRPGQIGIPVENIVQNPATASRGHLAKRMRLEIAQRLNKRFMSSVPAVIAETDYLKAEIASHWAVPHARIKVAPLGVDRQKFRPLDRGEARRSLGLCSSTVILLYVGVLDWTHDLGPLLEVVDDNAGPDIEVHIVGDGARRREYEQLASRHPRRIIMHGRVQHESVPNYMAAADLCLAPYRAAAFASGKVGYSSLKIPEYLACGRAVVASPGGPMENLIRDGDTGFLVPNDQESWRGFLAAMPSRLTLHEMGERASALPLTDWRSTAKNYLEAIRSTAAENPDWQGPYV